MSYVKGDWSGKRIDLSVHYFESIKTEVCFTGKTEVAIGNAKRIVDCINACNGMESPADEISRLRKERDAAMDELNRLADAFRFFIDDGERPSEFILAEWEFKAKKACS